MSEIFERLESTEAKPSKIVDLTDELKGQAIIITGAKKPDSEK